MSSESKEKTRTSGWMKWAAVAVLLVLMAFLVPSPAMMESLDTEGEQVVQICRQ